ncbi:hypothetical protein jhhlp_000728 [Lomentospora prolificans]|uniref:O-methyltransferase C-terminal domain-containing protein n=1 Tax=Lomentospora prolificans TaxID=41688 RepID=A0A2N3NJD8_9PEZI|nr:hypothetical protein jhhlp_000728 [Lomentospora prolificans]
MATAFEAQQPKTQPTTLTELAARVTELTQAFTNSLKENNIPAPTFAADSPTSYANLSPEMFTTRQLLIDALMDMWYLTQGPSESIFNYVHSVMPDAAALNVLNHFDFWSAVPLDGTASYADFAAHTHLPEEVVFRVLQHAVTLRLFEETEPGKSTSRLRHSSRSAALVRNPGLKALVSTILDDAGAPLMVLNEALARYSKNKPELTQEVTESAFALFHKSGIYGDFNTSWELLENDGEGERKGWRQRNFVEFMKYVKEIFRLEDTVLDCYDWAGAGDAMVVDQVGGSAGHDAFVLAKKFPNLRFTVEDLPEVKPVFEANRPAELEDRVSFIPHNFFDDQPVQGDIYMFKMIFHDWPDHEIARILRALKPSLKPGARVILLEYIGNQGDNEGPQPPRSVVNMGTATDLRLMALFNGKERPVSAWEKVIHQADPGFRVSAVKPDAHSFFAVIEAVWQPDAAEKGETAEGEAQNLSTADTIPSEPVAHAAAVESVPVESTKPPLVTGEAVVPDPPISVPSPAIAEPATAESAVSEAAPEQPSQAQLEQTTPSLRLPAKVPAPTVESVPETPTAETIIEERKDSLASVTESDTSVRTPEQPLIEPVTAEAAKVGDAELQDTEPLGEGLNRQTDLPDYFVLHEVNTQ